MFIWKILILCFLFNPTTAKSWGVSFDFRQEDRDAEAAALERQILQRYNVRVRRLPDHHMNHVAYRQSLQEFIREAERRNLGRRFVPEVITYVFSVGSNSEVIEGNRVMSQLGRERNMVSHILNRFPAEGTEAARVASARLTAVRQAIENKIESLRSQGVTVVFESKTFGGMQSDSNDTTGLNYFRLEDLLQGLVRLEAAVLAGDATRDRYLIVDKNILSLDSGEFNYSSYLDFSSRRAMERLLSSYMNANSALISLNGGRENGSAALRESFAEPKVQEGSLPENNRIGIDTGIEQEAEAARRRARETQPQVQSEGR